MNPNLTHMTRALSRRAIQKLLAASLLLGIALAAPNLRAAATILQAPAATFVAFEAENSTLNNPAGAEEHWELRSDRDTASGKQHLRASGVNNVNTAPHSFAYFKIKFATEGSYYVYTRWMTDPAVNGTDAFTGNSYWVANKLGELNTPGAAGQADYVRSAANDVDSSLNGAFLWTMETAPLINVTAAELASEQTFTIGTREAGMLVDRLVLSTDGALTPAQLDALLNSDTKLVRQGTGETHIAWEAETKGQIINPTGAEEFWVPITDQTASSKGALRIEGVNNVNTAPHSFVHFQLQFATEGTYYFYTRWMTDPARNGTDAFTGNSYWIANQFGALTTPDDETAYTRSAANDVDSSLNGAFLWTKEPSTIAYSVTSAEITGGPVTLTVGTREAGFTLDRIVLSTSDALTPAQLDAVLNSGLGGTPPELLTARGAGPLNKIILNFSRPIDAATVAASDFQISPTLQITGVNVNAEDARVVELTTAAQPEATRYTVTVSGISDTSGTPIAAINNQRQFSSLKKVSGWATREIFNGIAGATVDALVTSSKFQNDLPDRVEWVRGFDYGEAPHLQNIGVRMTARFTPEIAGVYNLFTTNDDELQLDISSTGIPENLELVALIPLTAVYNPDAPSPTPALQANQPAILRALLKQGGGDVYLTVAARHESDSTTPIESLELRGNRIYTYVDPSAGVVTFTEQPANATATVGSRATFRVRVTAPTTGPIYYQWQENNSDIPGAIRNTYTTAPLTADKNGKTYRCIVTVAGTDTASQSATLTVNPGTPPSDQPYIGVNFFGGGDRGGLNLLPADVAGAVPQENWNNITGFTIVDAPLSDASGAATPVTLTAEGWTEQWYSGTSVVGDANSRLMQGFIGGGATAVGTPVTFTFNNLHAGTYSVLAYTVGFDFQADYRQSYAVTGAAESPTVHGKGETGSFYIANPGLRRMTGADVAAPVSGNYVKIDNVSPDANGLLTLTVTTTADNIGGSHQPAINGIQLVKIVPQVAQPGITATRTGVSTVTLSWGADAIGFHFETTSSLTPGATWTTVPGAPNPITAAGSLPNVQIPTTGTGFYRLVK